MSSEDVVDALEQVKDAVKDVERAVKDKGSSAGYALWGLVVVYLWSVPGMIWHAQWRYALANGVDYSNVLIDPKPHDCNFLTAPVGEKYCHYERIVSTLQWATSTTGTPIASFDEGKTWTTFTPDAGVTIPRTPTVQRVWISWAKKED